MKFNLKLTILFIVFGTLICIAAGLIVFGKLIFSPKSPLFQFISYGVAGSVTFALLQSKRYYETLIINILLFFATYWLTGAQFFITHLLYYLSIVIAMYVYSKFVFIKFSQIKAIKPIIAGILLSILFLLITLILAFVYSVEAGQYSPFINMPVGFLIGFGLATGFEIAEYINAKRQLSTV